MIPGVKLQHTLVIGVSDFFSFSGATISDSISDGQSLDLSYTPTISIQDGVSGDLGGGAAMHASSWSFSRSAVTGITSLFFDVSHEFTLLGGSGTFVGGCVSSPNNCLSNNAGQTFATIVYRTVIDDQYLSSLLPPSQKAVHDGDLVSNTAIVSADVATGIVGMPGSLVSQPANTTTIVALGTLTKTVKAINGLPPGTPPQLLPGDVVTYRLVYTVPSSDFESLQIVDTLPLPTLLASTVTTFDSSLPAVPASGRWTFGPSQSGPAAAIMPTLTNDSIANSLTWNYGNFNSPSNSFSTLDLVFSLTVGPQPFDDNLYHTNLASSNITSTDGTTTTAASVAAVRIREPKVTVTKKAIASDNVRFSAATQTGFDAGDLVEFKIVLVNTGGAGAFNIVLEDQPDYSAFSVDPTKLDLQMKRTDGLVLTPASSATDLFTTNGLAIASLGPTTPQLGPMLTPANGAETLTITYWLVASNSSITPAASFSNVAGLLTYTNQQGSASNRNDSFATNPLGDPTGKTSVIAESPILDCHTPVTSESFTVDPTPASGQRTPIAVGERITLTHTVEVPEGTSPNVLFDVVWSTAGLLFVATNSVTSSKPTALTSSNSFATTAATISPTHFEWNWGTVTDTDRNNAVAENVTLVYTIAFSNTLATFTNGQKIDGSASWSWTSGMVSCGSPPLNLVIVEPVLTVQKTSDAAPLVDAGDVITYSIVISHAAASTTSAFDIPVYDALDPQLKLVVGSVTISPSSTAAASITSGNSMGDTTVGANIPELDLGQTVTITYQATIYQTTLGSVTPAPNTASITYYSLPSTSVGAADRASWTASGSATVNLRGVSFSLTMVSTSNPFTMNVAGVEQLSVGESFTVQVVAVFPEGTTNPAYVDVNLPTGYSVSGARIISIGSQITTTNSGSPTTSGGNAHFDFGSLYNAPDNVQNAADAITLQVDGVVNNLPVNTAGYSSAIVASLGAPSNNVTGSLPVLVVEPSITLSLSADKTLAQAGDTIHYTMGLSPSMTGSVASTLVLTYPLPSSEDFVVGSFVNTGSATPSSETASGGVVSVTYSQLLPTDTASVTFAVTVNPSVVLGSPISSTSSLTYESHPGSPPQQRTYTATASTSVNTPLPTITQVLFASSEPSTTDPNLTIGEHATFRIVVSFPGGTLNNVVLTDQLPTPASNNAVLKALSASLSSTTGSFTPLLSPSSATLSDSDGDGVKDLATWNLGNVVTSTGSTATFDVIAVPLDQPINVGTGADNNLPTVASLTVNSNAPSTATVNVNLVAPLLSLAISDTSPSMPLPQSGDSQSMQLQISSQPQSSASAFNTAVVVTLPTGMQYSSLGSPSCAGVTVTSMASTVTFNVGTIATGGSCTIPFSISLTSAVILDSSETVSASMSYTSTSPMTAVAGETRTGSATSSTSIALAKPSLSMSLASTSSPLTSDPSISIGETATFNVVVTVPPGTLKGGSITIPFPPTAGNGVLKLTSISSPTTSSGSVTFPTMTPTSSLLDNYLGDGIADTATVNFGDIVNSASSPQTVTVSVTGTVVNTAANHAGVSISGSSSLTDTTDATPYTASSPVLTIVEPSIGLSLSADKTSAQAGDTIHYTMGLSPSMTGSAASTLVLTYPLPSSEDFVAGSFVNTGSATPISETVSGGVVSVTYSQLLPTDTASVTFAVTVNPSVVLGSPILSTSSLSYKSPGSTTDQRTYTATASTSVNTPLPTITQVLFASSEPSTTDPNLTIGEHATFRIVVSFPGGTLNNVVLTDQLPTPASNNAVLKALSASLSSTTGSFTPLLSPSSATLSDSDGDGVKDLATWNLGNVVTSTGSTATFDVIAVPLDQPINVGTGADNNLPTVASLTVNSNAPSTATVNVNLVAPLLSLAISDTSPSMPLPQSGDSQSMQLQISSQPQSSASAFNTAVVVTLPTGMQYSSLGSPSCAGVTVTSMASTVTFNVGTIATGGSCTIPFSISLTSAVILDSSETVSASMSYTSTSPMTAVAGETRTGSATSSTSIALAKPSLSMSLASTSSPLTSDPSISIGETATFNVVVTVPPGTLKGGSITIPFPPTAGNGVLKLTSISSPTTSSGSVTFPTMTPTSSLLDNYLGDGIADTATVNFGDILNTDTNDATSETVTVQVTGRVVNTAANHAGVSISGLATFTDATDAVPETSLPASISIVEPSISLSQTVSIPSSSQIDFTATITAASGATSGPAQAFLFVSRFPAMTYVPSSVVVGALPAGFSSSVSVDAMTGDGVLTIQSTSSVSSLAPGQSVTLSYSVSPQPSVLSGTNTASVMAYDSQAEFPAGAATNGRLYGPVSTTIPWRFIVITDSTTDYLPFSVDLAPYLPSSPSLNPATLTLSPIPPAAGRLSSSGTVVTYTPMSGFGGAVNISGSICDNGMPSQCHLFFINIYTYYLRWVSPTDGDTWYMYWDQPIQWVSNLPADFAVYLELATSSGTIVSKFPASSKPIGSNYHWPPHGVLPGSYKMRIRTTTGSVAKYNLFQWPDSVVIQLRPLKPQKFN